MAEDGSKRAVWIGTALGGAAAVLLITPRGRRWLGHAIGSAREWLEYNAEDVAELVGARVERESALRRAPRTVGAAGRQVDEDLVIARVREALARDGRVRARKIKVMIIGGVVHLEGAVTTIEEKEMAGQLAREAARTHILVNDLHVG
ncbi:MAG: BON domain-containing protein [Armatimonadetes bacterium]|nr:BON domain-containing protein [Armatimonadota bacterium]